MPYRILPSFKTLTQSVRCWKCDVFCLCFTLGPVQGPCPADSLECQAGHSSEAAGDRGTRGAVEGHVHAREERDPPKTPAAVSPPLLRQWLAWRIQLFGYLTLPWHPRCSPLSSSLPPFQQGKLILSLVPSPRHPFGSEVAFAYVSEELWASPVWYTCLLRIYSILLHSLWVVTSPGLMYPGSINTIKIFMHIVAKRLGVFE